VSALLASVAAGESGPVIVLSGEADIASAAQLTALIGSQLSAGAVHLTINASGLRYADSMALHVLLVTAKILRARGGGLVLLRPQKPVAMILTLMAADQLITIRRALEVAPQPGSDAELAPGRRGPEPVVRRTGRTGSIDLRI
jgi:anti-anti-sigma factor